MTMPKRLITAIALCGLAVQGCVAAAVGGAAAGAGVVTYRRGEFRTVHAASLDRTAEATMTALQDLALVVDGQQQVSPSERRIEARKPDGTRVRVGLTPNAPDSTLVTIRVGTFGDEGMSRIIDRRLTENLGTS